MSEKKIVVPEAMLDAGRAAYTGYVTAEEGARRILEAALLCLSDNPIVPNEAVTYELATSKDKPADADAIAWYCSEWQRRMFLAPEPEVPEEIKDLLQSSSGIWSSREDKEHDERILEAYRRGREAALGTGPSKF